MNHVIESYQNYKEENRLTTRKARRIEFITSVRAMNELLPKNGKKLDCAAGTGIYSFYYANKGYEVTALDITPRHIDYIKCKLQDTDYNITADINDATDLSRFNDNSFDVVLCMGPMYHLIDKRDRDKCLKECIRVLKKGGYLVVAYISRFYIYPHIAIEDRKYRDSDLAKKIINTGTIKHDDPNCFWTDCYFAVPEELEQDFKIYNVSVVDHLATDGLAPFVNDKFDDMDENEFETWCEYHYSVCRERSILGSSNHGLIIGRK